jgi:hypothetical protein
MTARVQKGHSKQTTRPAKEIVVALVSETKRLKGTQAARVARALQTQLSRDLQPIWGVAARIETCAKAEAVPVGHWPLIVRDRIEAGALSFHAESKGRPYAMVAYTDQWSKSASHDLMEMIIDPFARRTTKGPSVVRGEKYDVDYLVQICDPCAQGEYRIDGVLVSDFSLPAFWSHSGKNVGPYSFMNLLHGPFQIARGGYLSWRDPKTNHWRQQVWWNTRTEIRDLGAMVGSDEDGSSEPEEASIGVVRSKAIRFRLTALSDVYRVQEPQLDSARATVESLIQRFGRTSD